MNYIIYPLIHNSLEARRITRATSSDNMLFPCFIFMHNNRNQNTLTRSSVIDKLEGNITVDILRDAMIKNIETKERSHSNTSNTTADLINQQKEELEHLERLEEQRKREEQDRIIKERDDKLKAEREVY